MHFVDHLLQLWFSLSDVQSEFQCQDRMSFRKFLGLSFNASIPDSTTLEDFRRDMRNADLDTLLLCDLDDFFKDAGLLFKQGSLVDATFMKANARPRKDLQDSSNPVAYHNVCVSFFLGPLLLRNTLFSSRGLLLGWGWILGAGWEYPS